MLLYTVLSKIPSAIYLQPRLTISSPLFGKGQRGISLGTNLLFSFIQCIMFGSARLRCATIVCFHIRLWDVGPSNMSSRRISCRWKRFWRTTFRAIHCSSLGNTVYSANELSELTCQIIQVTIS